MKKFNTFNESKKEFILSRVKDIINLCEHSPVWRKKRAEDIIDNINHFSDGKYGEKEKELFIELWNNKLDSKKREDSDEVYWEDLLDDLKRDMGEFTNIKSSDFRYLTEWLESKIINKKVTY